MKKENYLLEDFTKDPNVSVQNEFADDIVFARYINYMKKALLNKRLDFLKHQKYLSQNEQTISDREWTNLSDRDIFAHSFFADKNSIGIDKSIELRVAIEKLTEKQKKVILLHYYQEKPLNIIAKELNMKENAVRQLKFKAIIKLKSYIGGK